jgi:hypothetical protein
LWRHNIKICKLIRESGDFLTEARLSVICHIFSLVNWRNENIFLFVDESIHPKRKMTGNCIIARSAWIRVSVIFFWMDTPSTNKTNRFIPWHLIIWKYKYYGIKRYICMICICTIYSVKCECSMTFEYYITVRWIQNSTQYFNQ